MVKQCYMRKTFIAAAVAVGIAGLGAFALQAHPPVQCDAHHGVNPLEHVTKELNLTADQQAKVKPIIDAATPQIEAIHKEAIEKMRNLMENTATQIRPLLTSDQQQKLDAIKKAHEDLLNAQQEMHAAEKM